MASAYKWFGLAPLLVLPLHADAHTADLTCLTMVHHQPHEGCNGIRNQTKCLKSRDGRTTVEWRGIKIAFQPCVWCGGLHCTDLGNSLCEPADLMFRGQSLGVWKRGAPISSLRIAACPLPSQASSQTSAVHSSGPAPAPALSSISTPAPQIPLDAAVGPATQLPTTGANADSMLRPVEIHPRPVAMPSAERNGNLTHEEGNASTGASSGNRTLSTQAWVLLVLVLILCVPVPLLFIRNKQTLQSGKPKQPDVEQTLKRESEPLFAPTHMPTSAMSHAVPVYSPLSPTLASVGLPA